MPCARNAKTVAAAAAAAGAAAAELNAREGGAPSRDLDVEADVQHVAVLDDVGLPLEPLPARTCGLGVAAGGHEVVPADHLAADEPARDVGVDRRGRVERGAAAAQRP